MRQTLRFRTFLPFLALLAALPSEAQNNVGISADGATPDAKAVLDLNVSSLATKRGMLIPRITRAQRVALEAGLGTTDDGLWVYQTDDGTPYDPKDAHGLYMFNSTTDVFERMSVGRVGWGLRGNNYADVLSPYPYALGTANTSPAAGKAFILRSVSPATPAPQMFIDGITGMVGLNTATPVERLDVGGAIRMSGAPVAMTNEGTIFYGDTGITPTLDWHFGNIDGTTKGWRRFENSETVVAATTNNYPKDTLTCSVTPVAGTITQGTISGINSNAFPFRTAFTNEPPSADRGFRSQFIYRGTELTAAGLCPGDITSLAFHAVTAENVNAQVRIKIRIANTSLTQFSAGVTWDNAVQSSTAVFNPSSLFLTLISPGPIIFNFSTPFNWTGGNIVIDVSGIRGNGTNGVSPSVSVENTAYPSSRYFNVTNVTAVAPFPTQGDLIDDQGPTAPATVVQAAGSFSTATQRPVTTFSGNVKSTTYINGTAPYLVYSGALMLDSAAVASNTWAAANFKGPGTIRARGGAFDGTTQLSDHVFDLYYDGRVRSEDAKAASGYDYVSLPAFKSYLKEERHLPNMPSRAEWDAVGTRPLGELQTGLWETVETQALHIIELERDLTALETLAFGGSSDPTYWERMIAEVKTSARLSEQQKLHLIDALQQRAAQQTPRK